MSAKWLSYFSDIRKRLTINRGFFKGAFVVTKLYAHYKFGAGRQNIATDKSQSTIAFFPHPAGPWYNIWLVLQNTRLKIINDHTNADYIFIFDDSTASDAAAILPDSISATLINHRIKDISKTHVGQVFKDVFGYDLEVDPVIYQGKAVEKSDANGTHDGRIITCPLPLSKIKPGYSYQKLIDSTFNGKTSEDLRIAYVYGQIAAVFHKHKALKKRFGTEYLSTDVRGAADVFSDAERKLIAKFCDQIGLDFGAVDVMRDKHDGRIYIVDVNKTCMPVLSLPMSEQYRSLAIIAKVFESQLPKFV